MYGQIVHDALCMVFVVCHLSSFGIGWSVVVQFGYWWYTWSHVVHRDNYKWYSLVSCGTVWSLVVHFDY